MSLVKVVANTYQRTFNRLDVIDSMATGKGGPAGDGSVDRRTLAATKRFLAKPDVATSIRQAKTNQDWLRLFVDYKMALASEGIGKAPTPEQQARLQQSADFIAFKSMFDVPAAVRPMLTDGVAATSSAVDMFVVECGIGQSLGADKLNGALRLAEANPARLGVPALVAQPVASPPPSHSAAPDADNTAMTEQPTAVTDMPGELPAGSVRGVTAAAEFKNLNVSGKWMVRC